MFFAAGAVPASDNAPVRPAALQLQRADWLLQAGAGTYGPVPRLVAAPQGAWQPTSLPHVVPRTLVPAAADGIDVAWFRVAVPPASQLPDPLPLRFYLPRWQTIGQIAVYADGRLLFRSGAGPVWNGFNHPLWLPLEDDGGVRPRELLVRIDHQRSAGLALSSIWVGAELALQDSRWLREFVQSGLPFAASTGFLVIGLFALLVWVTRREAAYGLFFLCSALFFVRCLHLHQGTEPLPISEDWFGWWTVQTLPAVATAVNVFALRLAGIRMPRAELVMLALVAASAVALVQSTVQATSF